MIRVEIFAESRVGNPHYRMSWWPEHETDFFDRKPRYQREGVMEATLIGHQLLKIITRSDPIKYLESCRRVLNMFEIRLSHL